jgi:hypothetical protein
MRDTLVSFFDAIDAHDWAGMRQTLSDTVTLDATAVGRPRNQLGGDELVGVSRATGGGFTWTSHHTIHVREEPSGLTCDLVAVHYLPIPSGENWFTLIRRISVGFDNGGRINRLDTLSEQQTGNAALLDIVRQMGS